MNILVTGVGSTLGNGILDTLKKSNYDFTITGTDYFSTAVGLYKVNHAYILPDILSTKVQEQDWLTSVIKILKDRDIKYVLIGLDFEVPLFAKYKDIIEESCNCSVIVSSPSVVEICNDKWLTYCFLRDNNFNAPMSCLPSEINIFRSKIPYPWIIKPRRGSTSKGLYKVQDDKNLEHALENCDDPIIQEEVGTSNDEYTCGVIMIDNQILSSIPLRRELKNGNTSIAYYKKNELINNYICDVASKLSANGPINIQLMLTSDGPKIFEINPRFSGTTPVRASFGLNEIDILFNFYNNTPNKIELKEGMVIRHASDKYVSNKEIDEVTIL